MKRVVLLKSGSGQQGGLEKYAFRIGQAFLERGAQVTILTTGKKVESTIPISSVRTAAWPAFVRMEQFDRYVRGWLKQHPTDLVFGMDRSRIQTHMRAGNGIHAAYLEMRRLTEGRLKGWLCRLNPLHRKILELEKCALEYPGLQKLFTNSHMVREQALNYYDIDPKKIEVVHNGVEWDEMRGDFERSDIGRIQGLEKFNLSGDQFHFLFIGHGYLRKGLNRLLIGLSKLRRRDFHLSVIGKDNALDLYRAKAVQLGLKDQVRFFGPSQEIRLFYQLADCLVIPSFYDPFANVTVEALAMGLFVVSSKYNGGHEILRKENGAIIEDLLNDDAMVQALEEAMQHKKTVESRKQVRESVKHLDFSNQLQLLMDLCE
jgi:UDP-glucose:(heptosyl)LPS alpha-1,3-glucosyltransferase